MTLENLAGISLERIERDPGTIARLLEAAQRNVADYSGDLVPQSAVTECIHQADGEGLSINTFKSSTDRFSQACHRSSNCLAWG